MKSLLDMFNISKYRKSIPKSWCGLWTDKNGKQVIIKSTKHNFYLVTVLDFNKQPYKIKLLGNKTRKTIDLIGRFTKDINKNPILQVEAGDDGAGPTFNLYFSILDKNNNLKLAKNSDGINNIIIKTNVGMGLYDDYEDDLGVPWAFPLEYLKKNTN